MGNEMMKINQNKLKENLNKGQSDKIPSSVFRRRKALIEFMDISDKVGIEIGPYDRPIVTKKMAKILYADLRSTEELRKAASNTRNRRDPQKIVDVDIIISPERFILHQKVDFIVASHVLEHIPNPIGWIKTLESSLNPGGFVFLAVPDRHFTFDYLRPVTTLGSLLEKYRINSSIPSPNEVFDSFYYHVSSIKPLRRTHTLKKAIYMKNKAINGEYVGCHCNVFRSDKFHKDIKIIIEMGILQLKISYFDAAKKPYNDFICILTRQ